MQFLWNHRYQRVYTGPGAQNSAATSVVADIAYVSVRRLNDGTIGKAFNEYSRPVVFS